MSMSTTMSAAFATAAPLGPATKKSAQQAAGPKQHRPDPQQRQLTRADIRDEVVSALADFAEDALRRELGQLGVLVERAVQQAAEAAATAAKAAAALPPTTTIDGLGPSSGEDLRLVLDEWWASRLRRSDYESGQGVDTPGALGAPPSLKRQQSPTTTGGTRSQSAESYDQPSPPQSPWCLPPALDTSISETLVMPPMASPMCGPVSCPNTPMMTFSMCPNTVGKKDWRRSFVEKAFKAHRKIEFINGTQCRETHDVIEVMEEAIQALEDGIAPHLVEDGLGGTYFLKDQDGASIAVFKPRDEEPMALNNPKVHAGEGKGMGLKEGVLVGDASLNEYAAFLVDQASSSALQAGVCPTALVRVANSVFFSAKERRNSAFRVIKDKVGSFQLFAKHDCTSEDMGPSKFPANQVHRIAVLDIRLCNTDRHSGNILVRERDGRDVQLIPIDHGYALPGEVGGATFEWLSWPAAKLPFSAEMRRDILDIDLDSVEAALRRRLPALREECLVTLRTCTALLQAGVEAGLTAYDIGSMMTRPEEDIDYDQPQDVEGGAPAHSKSVLESLIASARRQAKAVDEPEPFERILDGLIRQRCAEMAAAAGERAA